MPSPEQTPTVELYLALHCNEHPEFYRGPHNQINTHDGQTPSNGLYEMEASFESILSSPGAASFTEVDRDSQLGVILQPDLKPVTGPGQEFKVPTCNPSPRLYDEFPSSPHIEYTFQQKTLDTFTTTMAWQDDQDQASLQSASSQGNRGQEMVNLPRLQFFTDSAVNYLFPPKPVEPYPYDKQVKAHAATQPGEPRRTDDMTLSTLPGQIDWGSSLEMNPISDAQFVGSQHWQEQVANMDPTLSNFTDVYHFQDESSTTSSHTIHHQIQQPWFQMQHDTTSSSAVHQIDPNKPVVLLPENRKKRSDELPASPDADKETGDSVAQSTVLRQLLPGFKRTREESSDPNCHSAVPSPSKRTKPNACIICRYKSTRCVHKIDGGRCSCCELQYNRIPISLRENPPIMKDMTFLATDDLPRHLFALKEDMLLKSTSQVFDLEYGSIICHLEPFRPGYLPSQLSDSSYPVRFCKRTIKADSLCPELLYCLQKSSMNEFMSRLAMHILPPGLRSLNTGIISTALQFSLWYGILSQLEENKIYQARNITTIQMKHALQVVVWSIILILEDLLSAIQMKINSTGIDAQEAKQNLCAVWIIHRFMNSHRKSTSNLTASKLPGLQKKVMSSLTGDPPNENQYDFETHLYERTKVILFTIREFRTTYGAFFCSVEEGDKLQSHIDLIALQSKLGPLINITLEKHDPDLPIGFLDICTTIYQPRSFRQVLESDGSALKESLSRLTLESSDGLAQAPVSKLKYPPTRENLKQVQLELGYCYSSADFELGSEAGSSSACGVQSASTVTPAAADQTVAAIATEKISGARSIIVLA